MFSLPLNLQDLRVLVGAVEKRVITRRGVELYGLYYNSCELARLRSNYEGEDMRRRGGLRQKEKATIKYDPTDLSKIFCLLSQNLGLESSKSLLLTSMSTAKRMS